MRSTSVDNGSDRKEGTAGRWREKANAEGARISVVGFIDRVKIAREQPGMTTQQVAAAMGIPHRRYLTYERNTKIRPWLIGPFCEATGAAIEWLLCNPQLHHNGEARTEGAQPP